jgi:hypothetical protein
MINPAEILALAHYAQHYRPKGLEMDQAEILALEADYANHKINITFSVDSSRGFYILWIGSTFPSFFLQKMQSKSSLLVESSSNKD